MSSENLESDAEAPTDEVPADEASEAPLAPRLELREPLTGVIDTANSLSMTCRHIESGAGPVALDAERASGYRYSQRAYLVQLRRAGSGTHLIDPTAFEDLHSIDEAIGDAEWILHAASQDLVCLAEVGLTPKALFDTELAGRLLNLPRVGLASLVENLLGHSLAKEFSAADWSTRPLPEPWLYYAALDVEVLIELRNILDEQLIEAGKRGWAEQEFEALLSFTGPAARKEPWRRTSGMHKARGRRALGVVRSLWQARDAVAEQRDTSPGRIIPDSAIIEIAKNPPADKTALLAMRIMKNRGPRRFINQWQDAIDEALAMPEADLPTISALDNGPPPARSWADKDPAAAARLGACREALGDIAERNDIPVENLLTPSVARALAWRPPEHTPAAVGSMLADSGARPWQIELTATTLSEMLDTEPPSEE